MRLITLHSFFARLVTTKMYFTKFYIYVLTYNANICFAFQYPRHLNNSYRENNYNEQQFSSEYQLIYDLFQVKAETKIKFNQGIGLGACVHVQSLLVFFDSHDCDCFERFSKLLLSYCREF